MAQNLATMKKNKKTIMWVIIIALILVIIWLWRRKCKGCSDEEVNGGSATSNTGTPAATTTSSTTIITVPGQLNEPRPNAKTTGRTSDARLNRIRGGALPQSGIPGLTQANPTPPNPLELID
jgi:hypothetical protein